ncbi:hypothetical protein Pmani_025153 [Petrolisthes manimaculis]|uniref:Secreted protein n=1 Tax=Petrolisthes manimaculis TaxID=1843537 RepID=A0AAE1P6Q9_9EUCA|nr:hypothetical protein Pmani_025153 [Petrolisthes manimaculis]
MLFIRTVCLCSAFLGLGLCVSVSGGFMCVSEWWYVGPSGGRCRWGHAVPSVAGGDGKVCRNYAGGVYRVFAF